MPSIFTEASFVAVDGVSEGQWLKIHSWTWEMAQQRGRGQVDSLPYKPAKRSLKPSTHMTEGEKWLPKVVLSPPPTCTCHGCDYTHIHCIHAKHVHSNNKQKIISSSYCGWRDGLIGKSTCCTNTASWVWISAPCRMLGMTTLGLNCNSSTTGGRDRRGTGIFWLSTPLEVQWELPVQYSKTDVWFFTNVIHLLWKSVWEGVVPVHLSYRNEPLCVLVFTLPLGS